MRTTLAPSDQSRTGVELARAWCTHYNRGDGKPSPAHWHEDAEYRTAPNDPDFGVHRGTPLYVWRNGRIGNARRPRIGRLLRAEAEPHSLSLRDTGQAMSQENVEEVKRLIAGFNGRDPDTFASHTTSDFEWITSMAAVEGEVFMGRDGIDTYFGRMEDAWDEFLTIADQYRDLGDRVLLQGRLDGRGRISGVPLSVPLDILFDLRDGKICRMHSFLARDEALRAAGLAE